MNGTKRNLRVYVAEFSATGNTRYLGAVLEHVLEAAGHTVTRVAIEEQPLRPLLPDCDLVLIGAPVYHCEPPANVVRYVCSLTGRNLPLVTYFSLGLYSGDCARILQTHAEAVGFRPIGNFEAKFPGSDLIALSGRNSIFVRLNRRVTRDLRERARRFVTELTLDAEVCRPEPKWYVPLNNLANRVALPAYRSYKEKMWADPEVCSQGYWCVKHCPVRAIRPDAGAVVFDPEKCIFCLRCYHACPHCAIRIGDGKRNRAYAGPQIARNFEAIPEYKPHRAFCASHRRPQ